ncbi:hypothetical protein [uncultured Cetobacterium sp.]|uniref:hypothetical protein n=1 Tax=uncultured Cetobacterium sp. TaxID=527638 RepID=UPI00262D58CE|nr:hypothetical protein [uncultured Cetobacterium sp.]
MKKYFVYLFVLLSISSFSKTVQVPLNTKVNIVSKDTKILKEIRKNYYEVDLRNYTSKHLVILIKSPEKKYIMNLRKYEHRKYRFKSYKDKIKIYAIYKENKKEIIIFDDLRSTLF